MIVGTRYPLSLVRAANELVFPSLEGGCKLLARLGNAQAIGLILLDLGAPVHVLQTGDDVGDIVHIAAVTVMHARERERWQCDPPRPTGNWEPV